MNKNHLSKTSILDDLLKSGVIKDHSKSQLLSQSTRDDDSARVYIDPITKVIYIPDYYIGDNSYIESSQPTNSLHFNNLNYEDYIDTSRRINNLRTYYHNKVVTDFGCGIGNFLEGVKEYCIDVTGIELNSLSRMYLDSAGIKNHSSIDSLENDTQDTIFLFHSFEHLHNPLDTLKSLHRKLKKEGVGNIVIEVPHAKDVLIDLLNLREFIQFTLWSQHLILHTRHSLKVMLEYSGFKNIVVQSLQRYPLSNHLCWLKNKEYGGHKGIYSLLDHDDLKNAYSNSLAKIDATDTLIAFAST